MHHRDYGFTDHLLMQFDQGLRTLFGRPRTTERGNPGSDHPEPELSGGAQRHVAGLMRINHAGEVCAQALYQGQALTAKLPNVRARMERAAYEENDHLAWCEQRLEELGSHKSWLNPLWYAGSLAIGAAAGWAGDKWSLGFVVETERQVVRHLDGHLTQLPEQDERSRAILEQMREDEQHHADMAVEGGAADLPEPIRRVMGLVAKVMTGSAYHL